MRITHNADAIARRWIKRALGFDGALQKGLRKAAIAIDREQVKNLSGTGAPHSYPVPVRKGTLRAGHGWAVRGAAAIVYNTTVYAKAVHDDRPFLDNAAESVDYTGIAAREVRGGFAV